MMPGLKSRAISCHMASTVDGHGKPKFRIHVVLSQASVSLPSLTKQETESACGGNGAIKFYEGLKLQSAFVSQ